MNNQEEEVKLTIKGSDVIVTKDEEKVPLRTVLMNDFPEIKEELERLANETAESQRMCLGGR